MAPATALVALKVRHDQRQAAAAATVRSRGGCGLVQECGGGLLLWSLRRPTRATTHEAHHTRGVWNACRPLGTCSAPCAHPTCKRAARRRRPCTSCTPLNQRSPVARPVAIPSNMRMHPCTLARARRWAAPYGPPTFLSSCASFALTPHARSRLPRMARSRGHRAAHRAGRRRIGTSGQLLRRSISARARSRISCEQGARRAAHCPRVP